MSFSKYKTVSTVLKEFQIVYTETNFIELVPLTVSELFREDLQMVMRYGVVDNSEFSICENLIYPLLKEVWKHYYQKFVLWGHQYLCYNDDLSGFPEYVLAKRSPLGKVVFDQPYFLLVEAKQDKFEEGWAQCLVEMIAAQKLNEDSSMAIYGIVSNGKSWEFGKLEQQLFTKDSDVYSLSELDKLFGVINYIFQQCELQLEQLAIS